MNKKSIYEFGIRELCINDFLGAEEAFIFVYIT